MAKVGVEPSIICATANNLRPVYLCARNFQADTLRRPYIYIYDFN